MSLAQLFSLGRVSQVFKIKDVQFKLVLLDTRVLSQALEAANVVTDEVAQALQYKKQILARALTEIDGEVYIKNEDDPDAEDVLQVNKILNKLHISIINGLYAKYEKLDQTVTKEVNDDLKNSSKNPGA